MRAVVFVCATVVMCGSVRGQTAPDYGFEWRTIGDPGNAPAMPGSQFPLLVEPVGRVDYTYRLTRTEVTNTQWLEFVDTYSRFHPQVTVINDLAFSGPDNYRSSNDPANFGWFTLPGGENAPARFSWFYAARFCNWLHNGKVNQAWAFESGAYTMSAYHVGPDGEWTGPLGHSPGARFWIPTVDEWTKGMYYDPNKNGLGQPGYWKHPAKSDTPLVGGPPGTPGAQTSAGNWSAPWPGFVPVGSYPDSQSPWGLLDGSGGVMEYNESQHHLWVMHGSDTRQSTYFLDDRLDVLTGAVPWNDMAGFRIASVVPSPGGVLPTLLIGWTFTSRRRHE
ncbi:MAG TPA: SUMF1/EgtB/PvdO family nonheme iron enzyme [Phycisphaerales bacterium]|nr:SUMF1/EgtB/PvdO family nonheme iron enzyme [Phycisphaerales bacterium]